MPAHARMDRDRFLQDLRRSGLLDAGKFRAAIDRFGNLERPRDLARALVDAALLTRFQAELLLIGRTNGYFLGPYRIEDQIGLGGMGRVYKAIHGTMHRTVALKVLAPHLTKTPKAQDLFRREAQAAAQLQHPNIVVAYDAGKANDRHYLAMEYVRGSNLDHLVRKRGRLPLGLACEIMRQAALGLQHAHEKGMVHRDVKPANILVAGKSKHLESLVVKLTDFGLARLHEPGIGGADTIVTEHNTVMGTPDFMSPEQTRSLHAVDIRSDLYSLGCTFFFLLTAQVPFPGGTTLEKMVRHVRDQAPDVRSLRPEVPSALAAIVARLLAKDPNGRYDTPADLARELQKLLAGATPSWHDMPMIPAEEPPTLAPEKAAEADLLPEGADPALLATLGPESSPTPLADEADPVAGSGSRRGRSTRLWWFCLGVCVVLATALAIWWRS